MAEREEPHDDSGTPMDEAAAWEQIVAGFGKEPTAGEGTWPTAEDLGEEQSGKPAKPPGRLAGRDDGNFDGGPRGFVIRAPQPGPRDYVLPDDEDEGHFVPPEPPPLPQADTTTQFAWIAVLGGPLLMVGCVLFQQPLTWWVTVLGVGGFVGGFATLVARMKDRDEDDDDPHGGAVV